MQRNALASLLTLATCAVLALGAAAQARAAATDVNGTWTWTRPGRNGGEDQKITLKLKVEGDKVTGKLTTPARQQGGEARATDIADGKIKGDEITFNVVREVNGNKMTTKYTGKVTADTIKGKIETERDGQTNSRDWTAKREAAKK
jgi:hypothetical protein